jgi:uncharacterized membrane protein YeaQ/YmgE (transglycosylase-associated protein family)
MGGVSVFAWIAIGAIASWTVTRLMVGPDDDALRGTAAGVIGAVLGGLGMQLGQSRSAGSSGGIDGILAALAGALWLTWITCVATSGREPRREPPPLPESHFEGADAPSTLDPSAPAPYTLPLATRLPGG